MKNILLFLEKASVRGGIEIFAERHAHSLRDAGNRVIISSELLDFSGFDEIIVHKCGNIDILAKFSPAKTIFYVHDHEPICPRGCAYTPLGRNCHRSGGLFPCIFCAPLCRAWRTALSRVFSQRRRIRILSQFKKIVVISNFMKSRLIANGIPSAIISVEPPTINVTCTSDGSGSGADLDIDMLYAGQLIRGKGVQLLLHAMAKMRRPRTLDIIGTGNMEPALRAMASKLGLSSRIRWHGFKPDPWLWMQHAKCVVVPSFWQEPFGLVAAEAVSLGCNVVAFAVGGLPEACEGKATLVPPGDIDALARALDSQD